jgi:hypothetical protein
MTLATILTRPDGACGVRVLPPTFAWFGRERHRLDPTCSTAWISEFQDQYQDLKLKLLPSEYWRRQCKATFQYDRVGTKLIDEMGVETRCGLRLSTPGWGMAESKKYIEEQFSHRPAETTHKMTRENAASSMA